MVARPNAGGGGEGGLPVEIFLEADPSCVLALRDVTTTKYFGGVVAQLTLP